MRIVIVSNIENAIGLQRDFELLRDFLSPGHEVVGLQYDRALPDGIGEFQLAIFLEVIPRNMLELAPVRWAFLNPEFATPDIVKIAQRHIHKVFAKTHEAKRIFDEVFTGKAHYVGFMARDNYDPSIPKENRFLNVSGNSSVRGAQEVLDAWKWTLDGKALSAHLTIVSDALHNKMPEVPRNVTLLGRVSDVELRILQNLCRFHLFPAGTEGYGHSIHESLGVNATLLVTDAPPFDEIESAFRIPAVGKHKSNLADIYEVSALDIYNAVNDLLEIGNHAVTSREEFLKGNEEFKKAFSAHLEESNPRPVAPVIRTKGQGLQIAFIGNFKASESTENMLRWALEEGLGHDVEMLQENEVNLAAIRSAMEFSDLLFWVRTPGWLRVSDREMLELLESAKIPTVSVHLDKFFGIPEREALIGVHPFWRTNFCFTADGSRDDDFKARNVNHFWMRPAVSEVYCHPGQPWDMYKCDVGFVGAREYHSEYPFRKQLVEFLEKTYGDRFKHITGLRGHGLNDFYSSCRVTVGDHIFAGIPRYHSDRAPETAGRGGFLLYPETEGLLIPCATYKPQNIDDLYWQIEFWLDHEKERREKIKECMEHVRAHDTWTDRMAWVIRIVQKGLGQASHA